MFIKKALGKLIALLSILAVTSCASPISIIKTVVSNDGSVNSLTNLPGKDGPILAVKIDDTPPAHPQVGLDSADVVYIEQVEGGLTRLAAIFSNVIPQAIGPIRSARISDIDLLAQYGKVGFAFSGAQTKFEPVIAQANLFNLSAERNPPTIYYRDTSRSEPTNMFLDANALLTKSIKTEGKDIAISKPMGWKFGSLPNAGKVILSAKISWPASRYEVTWSQSEKRWLLSVDGKPDLDNAGKQLGSPTFIIQKVSITDSSYHDKVGGITPLSNSVGSGTGYLLRDGQAYPINWNRPDPSSGTTWTLADGSTANFATGQIWIALTDKIPKFTYPASMDSGANNSAGSSGKTK
jgi:Protein of unknown function (DUF3048) N-terminal domain/Protein of unknown function (DUF3048) C-terminal domain